uniref:Uncharacterized protein n=1 Tax=Glossina austeni TaxID=7395 RepID=A0A1A9UEJ5_GLOAU
MQAWENVCKTYATIVTTKNNVRINNWNTTSPGVSGISCYKYSFSRQPTQSVIGANEKCNVFNNTLQRRLRSFSKFHYSTGAYLRAIGGDEVGDILAKRAPQTLGLGIIRTIVFSYIAMLIALSWAIVSNKKLVKVIGRDSIMTENIYAPKMLLQSLTIDKNITKHMNCL